MKKKNLILVIEDDHELGKTIKNLLLLNGFDVCYCDNGASGIQKTFELNPDLILCDITMDPIDGYNVYSVLSESNYINNAPFIFLSGNSDLEDIRFGLDLGADDYIVKPFNNDNLIRIIQKRIDKVSRIIQMGQNEFEALMKVSPYGIAVFDDSYIYNANEAFVKMVDLPFNKIKSQKITDFFDPKFIMDIEKELVRCMNKVSPCKTYSVKLLNQSGLYNLYTTLSKKYKGYSLITGIFLPAENRNDRPDNSKYDEVLEVLRGESVTVNVFLAEKLQKVFGNTSAPNNHQPEYNGCKLSKREEEVLRLSCKGMPIKQIAQKLYISDRTVEKHRASLMEKTETVNIVELMIYAIKNQLVKI